MFEMAMNSAKLFLAGKLFRDTTQALAMLAAGMAIGALALVLAAFFAPLWLASLVGGLAAGAAQPVLYKNLKYA
ncbi:MAG: hypothetical protein KGI57_07555 [Hyphomicrobiales bacterium]|nr:hypothetical protein [Hyphomicrobiales bacterium]